MKRINMIKYGFERCPEQDFSDDGNRFQVYRAGTRVRVSKHVSGGYAYISAYIDGAKLPYDVYSKLAYYKKLDVLNGVSCDSITEQDLFELFDNCLSYEEAYNDAERSIKMPTLDEIIEQCEKVQDKRREEIILVERLIAANLPTLLQTLSDYHWSSIKRYYNRLVADVKQFDPENYVPRVINNVSSIHLCEDRGHYLEDSFSFKSLVEIIEAAAEI